MNSIQAAYINALLADASYVNVSSGVNTADMRARMTATQSAYIAANFEVVNQELSATNGFDAVVWRGKSNSEFAGQVFVSMRGTQGVKARSRGQVLPFASSKLKSPHVQTLTH